ncbi:unnamed protein product [Cyprideis torosa]|uniref:Uncharacterized protein n=1 Tax=Cyprideis torosa TaxID=163714 RepID=A0A7R8W7R3_9CRUS|nr:unnamed protein product [Cyprideis torosa]CAG0887838.1 unnamed protein product [Cyprideis torosa]
MFVLLLLVEAVSVSACNFGDNNWALGCDFPGNDFKNLQIPGEQCGPACVDDARCTHFTWNTYKDGTCWLKEGQASDIICNNDQGFVCGQIVHKNCEPNFGDKNWAFQCDFPGNDIRNVKVEASECGQACSDDARCTHFAWNKDDGCWLKGTKKLFTDAVCTRNPSDICGCVRGCDEGLDTLKDCKPKFGDKSWALRCEFPGEGFKTVQVPASGCGPTCLWDTRCTHFSWTSANNGSCVLKSGRIAFSDAICTKDFDTVCGCERNCSRGWGATSTTQKSEVLLQVNTPVLTDSECNATVRSTTYHKDKMLCAAAEDKSICRGDSGGPLMIQVDEKWTIFGVAIASGGTGDECGTGLPSIYTRVDHYYNWIENILYGRIGR